MTTPIYVSPGTPEADLSEIVAWTAICQKPQTPNGFYWIDHKSYRNKSRWTGVERKRKFRVTFYTHGRAGELIAYDPTFHATLDKAKQHAAKLVALQEETERKAEYERTRPRWTREYTITVKVTSFTEDGSDVTQTMLRQAIVGQADEAARLCIS